MRHFDNVIDQTDKDTESISSSDHLSIIELTADGSQIERVSF